ncbi:MAG: carboxypeptidase regulatory-like domain-containing protein [Planctomycetota bacterium]|nr:MAG: carboxypeptidase regulatory-like domain-containing protein [Planctomycetota bacterium]
MKRFAPAFALLMVLVAIAAIFWKGGAFQPDESKSTSPSEQTPTQENGGEAWPEDSDRQTENGQRQPGNPDSPDRPGGVEALGIPSFRGRLVDPDGQPVLGSQLQVYGMTGWAGHVDWSDPALRPWVHWTVKVAPDGRFQVPESPRDGLRFLLRAEAPPWPPQTLANLPSLPGRTRDLGTWSLSPGFELRGKVQDAAGKPLAGALIQVFQIPEGENLGASFMRKLPPMEGFDTRSRADGSFRIAGLPAGKVKIRGQASGYLIVESAPVEGGTGRMPPPLNLVLAASHTWHGRLLDPEGNGVPQAWLRLRGTEGLDLQIRSQDDGRFQADVPPALQKLRMDVAASGFLPAQFTLERTTLERADEENRWTATLDPVEPIRGLVQMPDGQGVAGAEVVLLNAQRSRHDQGHPKFLPALARTRTALDGSFELPWPAPTETPPTYWQVAAWSEQSQPDRSPPFRLQAGNASSWQSLSLTLESGGRIHGFVQDPNGRPVADARVHLRRLHLQRNRSRLSTGLKSRRIGVLYESANSDAQGRFAFDGLPAADYRLEAYHREHSPVETPDFALLEGSQEHLLVLQESAELHGEVLGLPPGLHPLRITVERPDGDPLYADLDSQNRFRISHLMPATYALSVREVDPVFGGRLFHLGGGRALARQDGVELGAGESQFVVLEVDSSDKASLSGQVLIQGQAAAGMDLFLLPMGVGGTTADPRVRARFLSENLRSAKTDEEGRYRFPMLEPEDSWLIVERDGATQDLLNFQPQAVGPQAGPKGLARAAIQLRPGQASRQDFNLALGSISGRASGQGAEGNQVLAGGFAILRPQAALEGVAPRRTNLSAGGSFRFDGVPAGPWLLELQSGPFREPGLPVQIRAGKELELQPELRPRSAETHPESFQRGD